MSNFINIQLTDNANAIVAKLQHFPEKMSQALCRAMDYQNELTIGHIQADRMSARGPFTLGVVTNRLRGSIRRSNAAVFGNSIIGKIGSNVVYMGVHEFGFDDDVTVNAYTRRCASRNVQRFVAGRETKRLTAIKLKTVAEGIAQVRSFTRHMRMPERAPIRLGISDRRDDYSAAFSRAIIDAWQGGAN